jgi:DNA-directed RNA polymerase specialized sigma24 family protein
MALFTGMQTVVAELTAAGLSRREVGAVLRLTPSAVKKRNNRARKRAAARLATQARYARALASNGGKPVRFKPFSLKGTDPV